MYIKLKDGIVDKYPYSVQQLKQDNPDTSFPAELTNERLAEWDVYPVVNTNYPQVDYTKNVTEETPNLLNSEWYQDWAVTDATPEEIAQREADMLNATKQQRAEDYRNESDPLFFKAQRNEATMEEWIAKVNEIKARYL